MVSNLKKIEKEFTSREVLKVRITMLNIIAFILIVILKYSINVYSVLVITYFSIGLYCLLRYLYLFKKSHHTDVILNFFVKLYSFPFGIFFMYHSIKNIPIEIGGKVFKGYKILFGLKDNIGYVVNENELYKSLLSEESIHSKLDLLSFEENGGISKLREWIYKDIAFVVYYYVFSLFISLFIIISFFWFVSTNDIFVFSFVFIFIANLEMVIIEFIDFIKIKNLFKRNEYYLVILYIYIKHLSRFIQIRVYRYKSKIKKVKTFDDFIISTLLPKEEHV